MTTTLEPLRLADFATEMISLHDGDGRFVSCSPVCADVLGHPAEDLLGRRISDLVHPEDARALEIAFEGTPGEPRLGAVTTTGRLRHADGYWAWTQITVRPAPGATDGSTIVCVRNAAELVAARQSGEWAEETLRQVFDHAPTAMAMLGLDNRFERVNPAFCALLDTGADQLIGRTLADLSELSDSPGDRFALGELVCGRIDQITSTQSFLRPGRSPIVASTRRSIAHSVTGRQHVVLHVVSVREGNAVVVPEQGGRTEQSRPGRDGRATNEPVTGLTSRALLLDRLHLAAARPERQSHFLAMFFVDLDGTGKILERHGRRSLEGVLTTTANRLRAAVRTEDTVARFGDRGFVVLCPVVAAGADVASLRQRLSVAVADGPILSDGHKFRVSATVGAALTGPGEDCDPETLLQQADEAMANPVAASRR